MNHQKLTIRDVALLVLGFTTVAVFGLMVLGSPAKADTLADAHDRLNNHAHQLDFVDRKALQNEITGNQHRNLLAEHGESIEELEAGVAGALALGSHHFDLSALQVPQVSVTAATYAGQSAGSVSAGYAPTDNVFVSIAGFAASKGDAGGSVGVSFKFR